MYIQIEIILSSKIFNISYTKSLTLDMPQVMSITVLVCGKLCGDSLVGDFQKLQEAMLQGGVFIHDMHPFITG